MSAKTRRFLMSVGVALMVIGALPAAADTEGMAGSRATDDSASAWGDVEGNGVLVVADPSGDANLINSQGMVDGLPDGVDTRPASIDGADIEKIWFSSPFETVRFFNEDGTVASVIYEPLALRIRIQVQGDVLPTLGPSLVFKIPTSSESCSQLLFEAWVRGPDAPPEHPQHTEIRSSAATQCGLEGSGGIGGSGGVLASESFTFTVEDNLITMEYPLEILSAAGLMTDGSRLDPQAPLQITPHQNKYPLVHLVSTYPPLWEGRGLPPVIDEAPTHEPFVIGSDVPAPVVCSTEPSHPDCQA